MNILNQLKSRTIPSLESILDFILEYDYPITKHPLGFYCCKVTEDSENENIRIHFWLRENCEQKGFEIHNHIFNLESFIIDGIIKNTTYEISNNHNDDIFHIFKTSYNNDKSYIYRDTNDEKLRVKNISIYSKDQKYALSFDDIHQSEVLTNKAVTLMYTKKISNHQPIVYSKINISELNFHRALLSRNEKIELIKIFKECSSNALI